MPARGVKSRKRARQYEHIKGSATKKGRSSGRAKQIAAATVNKQRRQAGGDHGSRKSSSRKTSGRKTSGRNSSSRKSSKKRRRRLQLGVGTWQLVLGSWQLVVRSRESLR